MKIRKSFYLRWLLQKDGEQQPERSVIDIEHIQTGEQQRVFSWEEAGEWIKGTNESPEEVRIKDVE